MRVTYENGWEHTDVHVDLEIPYTEDYQMHMLDENDIIGLIRVKGCGREEYSRYTYRLKGGISMGKLYSASEMRKKDVEKFITDLLETVEDVIRHLLDPDGIILSPDMVFLEDGRYRFCYLPGCEHSERSSLCRAFHHMTEYFVKRLDYRDTEGIFLVYKLHKDTMQESFELRKIIESCRAEEPESRKEASKESGISQEAVFSFDEEIGDSGSRAVDIRHNEKCVRQQQAHEIREHPVKYGRLKNAVRRMKNKRWGEWQDLITEMDGHE